ncbi:hypothetical protein LINGRAPRIM_LOCUS3067 [Linum grandiflorum]
MMCSPIRPVAPLSSICHHAAGNQVRPIKILTSKRRTVRTSRFVTANGIISYSVLECYLKTRWVV